MNSLAVWSKEFEKTFLFLWCYLLHYWGNRTWNARVKWSKGTGTGSQRHANEAACSDSVQWAPGSHGALEHSVKHYSKSGIELCLIAWIQRGSSVTQSLHTPHPISYPPVSLAGDLPARTGLHSIPGLPDGTSPWHLEESFPYFSAREDFSLAWRLRVGPQLLARGRLQGTEHSFWWVLSKSAIPLS